MDTGASASLISKAELNKIRHEVRPVVLLAPNCTLITASGTPMKIYGAARCHKTQYYIEWLTKKEIMFSFLDVEENEEFAEELRNLYQNRKLNFPTITIGSKKLRNPTELELNKFF